MSCGVVHRGGSDAALLWLWFRLTAEAPIQPLAWELPYARGVTLKSKKKSPKIVPQKKLTLKQSKTKQNP